MPSTSASALDAVTVDAMGTIVELDDPRPRLRRALAERGVERELDEVAAAFQAGGRLLPSAHARGPRRREPRRPRAAVHRRLPRARRADLDPAEFAPAFSGANRLPRPWRERRPRSSASAAGRARPRLRLELGRLPGGASRARGAGRLLRRDRQLRRGRVGEARSRGLRRSRSSASASPRARAPHRRRRRRRARGAAAGLAFEPVPLATLPERLGLGRRP